MAASMDEKQMQIEHQLRQCSGDELEQIAKGIGIEETNLNGKSTRAILRLIQEAIDEKEGDEKTRLMLSFVPIVPLRMSADIMQILVGRTDELEVDMNRSIHDVSNILQAMGFEPGSTNSTLRREFKISGSIAAAGHKDRITYINLCSQIEDGRKKGYTSEEIAQAIKKAVSPGTELRTILDAKSDMSLGTMISFVRGYLKEKTATELYKDLNDVFQGEKEDPQAFVLRAMGIREKILKASEAEPEGALRYDKNLVHNMFLHAIRTGLRDDAVKNRVDGLLNRNTLDEELLLQLNTAALEEEERKLKRGATEQQSCLRKKTVSINQTSIAGNQSDLAIADIVKPLLETVELMREEVGSLREDIRRMKMQRDVESGRSRGGYRTVKKRGCEHCTKDGKASTCRHCWNCGAGDHISFNCRKQSNN